jgi:hypothetical protein
MQFLPWPQWIDSPVQYVAGRQAELLSGRGPHQVILLFFRLLPGSNVYHSISSLPHCIATTFATYRTP